MRLESTLNCIGFIGVGAIAVSLAVANCTPGERQAARTIVDNVHSLCGDVEHGAIVLPGKAGQEAIVLCAQEEEARHAANAMLESRATDAMADAETIPSDSRE